MDVQQLFNALKTKYPQSGLSENEIMSLAVSLFATGLVTDENLSTIVDGQADAVKGFQSIFDKRFTSQRDAFKKTFETDFEKAFKAKYKIGDDGKQIQEDKPDDISALISKALDEKLKLFTDKFAAEETRRATELRTAQILEKAKAHGISEELAKLLNVPSDVTDLDSFMKDKSQQLKNLGFQPSVSPEEGGGGHSDGKTFAEQIRAGIKKEDK